MTGKKIVVLGGAFNPPTIEHLNLMLRAIKDLNAEFGIFVPASDSAVRQKMKNEPNNEIVYSQIRRYQMLSRLCETRGNRPVTVDICEYGKSDTCIYDTLTNIQSRYPEHTIIYIIDRDTLQDVPTWYKSAEILQQFRLAIATRNGRSEWAEIVKIISTNEAFKAVRSHFWRFPSMEGVSEESSILARELIQKNDWDQLSNIMPNDVLNIIWHIDGK